jgi:hypothetical protein
MREMEQDKLNNMDLFLAVDVIIDVVREENENSSFEN